MPFLDYESLELVPTDLREHAKTVENGNGKVRVNVVPASKIDEFRDNNIKLRKDFDDLTGKFTSLHAIVGDDPDTFTKNYAELQGISQRVKDGELKESRQIEEQLGKRTEEQRKSYDERLQQAAREQAVWRQKTESLDKALKQQFVTSAVKDGCMEPESGVDLRAISEITMIAQNVFEADEKGKLVAKDSAGQVVYGADGEPMKVQEWLQRMKDTKPFFFKTSNGGGGSGNVERKGFAGLSAAQMSKLTPAQKLAVANGEKVALPRG